VGIILVCVLWGIHWCDASITLLPSYVLCVKRNLYIHRAHDRVFPIYDFGFAIQMHMCDRTHKSPTTSMAQELIRRLIAVVGVLLTMVLTTDSEAGLLNKDVAQKVTQLIGLLRDESVAEYKEVRDIRIAKLTSGITVAVAVFTLEGFSFGNDYTQFMAVFSTTRLPNDERILPHIPPRLVLIDFTAVGGRLWRNVESKNIKVREKIRAGRHSIIIRFDTVDFTPEDAACCPSKKAHATYTVELWPGSRLKEIH
jgi:hypothetical protein